MSLEQLKVPLRRYRLYRALRFAWHFAIDPVFRRDHWLRVRPARGQFQFRSFTQPNRYPRIFAFLRDQLGTRQAARVLSFGCATGEEVFTLRDYLPEAELKGIDVNALDVAVAERRRLAAGDGRMEFACAASADGEPAESCDAVLCLAVFQHSALNEGEPASCERFIRFADFDRVVSGLARCVKPGGFLAIRWAQFHFEDATCAAEFRPVLSRPPEGRTQRRFGRDNRRLPDAADRHVVWQKKAS